MPKLFDPSGTVTLNAAAKYPRSNQEATEMGLAGNRNSEMRAMTIAAFRVSQNNSQLSDVTMDARVLLFLIANSSSALNHWIKQKRLEKHNTGYRLTSAGIEECKNSIMGNTGGYNTSEEKVSEWTSRMLKGDFTASVSERFTDSAWV